MNGTSRTIGIRHRWKDLAGKEDGEGMKFEDNPTLVAVQYGKTVTNYKLQTETDELDFLLGRFPTSWRELGDDEPTDSFFARHVIIEKSKRALTGRILVPESYLGLQIGDIVVMALGGSGDRFAYALSRRGEEIGASVYRIEPGELKRARDLISGKKDDDPELLIKLFGTSPSLFRFCGPCDRDQIKVAEALSARQSAQDARKACAQRLRQRLIGGIFLSDEGKYPEGKIEDVYGAASANDIILSAVTEEEARCDKELRAVVETLEVYRQVFEPVEGCGPALAARIIASVGDIRRFPTVAKFKAFCGVHVLGKDGTKMLPGTPRTEGDSIMARRRRGQNNDWSPDAKQGFYLLCDQFVKRADSVWGKKLREFKVRFRVKYPDPVVGENGKQRFTNGHIHSRAIQRTGTKFAEYLYKTWRRLEREAQ